MINRLRLYDPDFDNLKMPDIDLGALDPKRQTTIERDKFGDIHLLQKREGVTNVIVLDSTELDLVLRAIHKLLK